MTPIDHHRPSMMQAEAAMGRMIWDFLHAHNGSMVAPMLRGYPGKSLKGFGDALSDEELAAEVERLLSLLDTTPFEELPAEIRPLLEGIAKDGGRAGLSQVNAGDIADALKAVDERAVEWAAEHSAEMVGMKWVDGELVPNPDTTWNISASTREMVRSDVTQAFKEGWSNQTLQHALEQSDAFSRERAETIARTETASADASANQAAWKESGMVSGKDWLLSENPCEVCIANAAAGVIGLNDAFPSGDTEEPAHPRCECVTAPVLKEE